MFPKQLLVRVLVRSCLMIERDSMAARVSIQFHNTEAAAAAAAAAPTVARCKVAAVYVSISLNRRRGARRRGQSRAQQRHTAKIIAGLEFMIAKMKLPVAVLAAHYCLVLCCCYVVLLLQLLLRLAATECVATVCSIGTAAAALRLALPPPTSLGCRCCSYAVFLLCFVRLVLFAARARSPI